MYRKFSTLCINELWGSFLGGIVNSMIKKLYNSTVYSLQGLRVAFRKDKSFRLEVLIGTPILFVVVGFLWPLTMLEWYMVLGAYFLILITELVNTSIEKALARLHPMRHIMIGWSKDVASAAVFMAIAFSGIVLILIILSRNNIL